MSHSTPSRNLRHEEIVLHVHAVWAVGRRVDFLTPAWERMVYRCITAQVEAQKCEVLALGGMPDHVHLVARLHGSVSASAFMKQVKGHSSRFINAQRAPFTEPFHWQDGFALFAVGHDAVSDAIAYVKNQRQHHEAGTTRPYWEEMDEAAPPSQPRPAQIRTTFPLSEGQPAPFMPQA